MATQGMLVGEGCKFFTIEQPWNNNLNDQSCVPDGDYQLIPYQSPKHGATWILANKQLGVYGIGNVIPKARYYCELHSSNWASQLKGCIALGLDDKPMVDPTSGDIAPAIESSKTAIAQLLSVLGPLTSGHTLNISPASGVTGTDGYVFHT